MIRITVHGSKRELRTFDFKHTCVRIGRRPDNDVVVNDRSVSGYHGEIRLHPEGLIYEDLKSTNGSQISREERTIS
ncbi:MAG: FHA domain-containing protein, partial [Pseudomonadota bacterium]